jgi:hypothetical protein
MATMTMLEAAMRGDLIAFTNFVSCTVHLRYFPVIFFFSAFRLLWRFKGIEHLRVD